MSIPIQLGSAATKGEGRQSILCAYLAGALLGNAIVGAWWLDAVVGLLIAAVAIKEGREAWRGEGCCVNSPLDGTGFTDDGCGDDCCKQTTEAIPPSCSLDPDALRAQLDRYATIGKTVLSTKRSPSSFVLQLSPEADPGLLVEETLRIESACCTFFRLAFDSDRHLLTIAVDRGDVPALDAIASARSASDNWRSLRLDSRLCFGLPGEPTFGSGRRSSDLDLHNQKWVECGATGAERSKWLHEILGGPVSDAAATRGGSTFPARCSVVVVNPSPSSPTAPSEAEELLRPYVSGERGGKLRSQLAALHPDSSKEKIEEAIQAACDRFVDKAEGISAPGQVYTWVRTTAHRILNREEDQRLRELPVDPTHTSLSEVAAKDPGPAEEAIAHEDEAELVTLVREVSDSLPERKREILALYGAGYKRPEIASRLGLSERAVKRDLLEIMDEARAAIARKAGGGCLRGEPLVLRFAYGLASAAEAEQAQVHMKGCHRCGMLWERLDAWREKAAVVLPAPAIEQASPGLLGRLAHRTVDGISSVKQQVLGGASQTKQQVAAGASQVKQQAATTYYRAVDPTPLAGARPGAVAAVLISCVTIGGGAATYCAQNGVDPIDAAAGLIPGGEEPKPTSESPPTETPESTAVVPPAATPEVEQPAAESEPAAQPVEEPQPTPEPSPPPPEQSFEPSSPDYPAVEAEAEYQAPETSSTESARPAPVSGGGSPQFGGP